MKIEVLNPNKHYGGNGKNGTVLASLKELEEHFGPNTFEGSGDDKVSHQYSIKVGNKIVEIWAYKYNPEEYGNEIRTGWSIGEVHKGAISDFKKEVPKLDIFHGTELAKIQNIYGYSTSGLIKYLNENKKKK